MRIDRDPRCRLCGDQAGIRSLSNPETETPQGCVLEHPSVSAAELRGILSADPAAVLIDVRQPEEHARAAIPGSRLIPLAELAARLHELPDQGPVYVHCKSGKRSAQAVDLLRRKGIDQAVNVAGGIDAWLAE